jgi:hypothetical protein
VEPMIEYHFRTLLEFMVLFNNTPLAGISINTYDKNSNLGELII